MRQHSYRVDIETIEQPGWLTGSMRYTTRAIAEREGAALKRRWTVVTGYRVTTTNDPPTHGVNLYGMTRPIDQVYGAPQSAEEAEKI